MLAALSTAHKLGLGLSGVAFIAFALVSAMLIPRTRPDFPGRRLGWFVFGGSGGIDRMVWHYGWHPDAFSSLFFKIPERQLTLILLASTDRASSVFLPGNGDPLRSAFVTAFLDTFTGDRTTP